MPAIPGVKNMRRTKLYHLSSFMNYGLIIPLFSGFFLRFYQFRQRIGWWGDVASDHLMARHIVWFGEFPIVGHPASGFTPEFYYPPYFYYLMAALTILSDSYLFRIGFFTFLHSLSVVAMYGIGRKLAGTKVGLLAALYYAFSFRLITVSQVSTPPYAVVPVLLFLLWGYIESGNSGALGKYGWIVRYILHTGLIFATTWYWGAALFIPVAFLFELSRHTSLKVRLLNTVAFTLLTFLILLPLVTYFGFLNTIATTVHSAGNTGVFTIQKLLGSLWIFSSDFFFYDVNNTRTGILLIIGLIVFSGKRVLRYLRPVLLPLMLLGIFLLGTFLLSRPLRDHDVHSTQALLFIVVASVIVGLMTDTVPVWRKGIVAVVSIVLFIVLLNPAVFLRYRDVSYQRYQDIAQAITKGISDNELDNLRITVITPSDDTNDHLAIWYFIEDEYKQRFLEVIPEVYNFRETTGDRNKALVCLRFHPEDSDICRSKFTASNPDYMFNRTLTDDPQRILVYLYSRM